MIGNRDDSSLVFNLRALISDMKDKTESSFGSSSLWFFIVVKHPLVRETGLF